MPSWNVHLAHAERLLAREGAEVLGVRDTNAFLFGNVVPDIYVGFMVPDLKHRIDYKLTHLAEPAHIPLPDYRWFYRLYMRRSVRLKRPVSDLVLGAWTHLICDYVYNSHTRSYLEQIGHAPDEEARVGKQDDFDIYGRSLVLSMRPEPNDALFELCEKFPPYSIDAKDVRAALTVVDEIVRINAQEHVECPHYDFLTSEFFEAASREAEQIMVESLKNYAVAFQG